MKTISLRVSPSVDGGGLGSMATWSKAVHYIYRSRTNYPGMDKMLARPMHELMSEHLVLESSV